MHPKLSDATRQERRDQILDGARACVDEHGLEAVSMEMIIARSGVSTGTVYRYFSGKDEVSARPCWTARPGSARRWRPS
jgi:TetR/AcrR family transcriptional regulator, transcriptional repressor of aconitase